MNKKEYVNPEMTAVELKSHQFLMSSPVGTRVYDEYAEDGYNGGCGL